MRYPPQQNNLKKKNWQYKMFAKIEGCEATVTLIISSGDSKMGQP